MLHVVIDKHVQYMYYDVISSWWFVIQCSAVITQPILKKYSQKIPHSSPLRARYGVSSVDPSFDWYSASVPVNIYVISYNIGPCYNGTRLYFWADSINSHEHDEFIFNKKSIPLLLFSWSLTLRNVRKHVEISFRGHQILGPLPNMFILLLRAQCIH